MEHGEFGARNVREICERRIEWREAEADGDGGCWKEAAAEGIDCDVRCTEGVV